MQCAAATSRIDLNNENIIFISVYVTVVIATDVLIIFYPKCSRKAHIIQKLKLHSVHVAMRNNFLKYIVYQLRGSPA